MFYQYDVRPPPSFTHSANLSGMFRKYGRSSASVRAFQTFQMAVRSSVRFFGCSKVAIRCFMIDHTFSTGLKSGDTDMCR